MFRQTVPPDLIVLYLSKEQFPQEFKSIPQRLNNLYKLGYIDIVFTDGDLRSHKKYFYSFQQYGDEIVILIDDDLFYTKRLIQELMELHHQFPNRIICHRGHLVTRDSEEKINPYSRWKVLRTKGGPSSSIFHTSGGATLYEPNLFNTDLFNVQNIKTLCFYADDVWLNIHAFISGIKIVKTNYYSDYLPILNIRDVRLSDLNVAEGMNDQQIIKTSKYYGIDEKDIFND
ncbi:hypothetical protein ACFQ2C_12785 [Sphingobacterium daejeonense]|uniref:Fucose 4-O-acetylase and related acetyltransferases n=1 Tax=Sphingobacterium daejeonense TaxID=371142 RepID=A0ABW3RP86_9SPHI